MQVRVDESTYRKALEHSLERITFDRSSGDSFSFEELFYPLEIDEGTYAFQSYAEQMDRAREASKLRKNTALNRDSVPAQAAELKEKISDILSRITSSPTVRNNASGDGDDIRALRSEILGKIQAQQSNQENTQKITPVYEKTLGIIGAKNETESIVISSDKNVPPEKKEELSTLEFERQYDHNSLVIEKNTHESRILAIASAGHGKTTLLRRIALYYCHPFNNKENHKAIFRKYSLTGDFIPCLIQLRDITDQNYSVDKAVERSIISTYKSNAIDKDTEYELLESHVQKWVKSVQGKLLLLIDGLDELSDSMRYSFLSALDDYLRSNPQTPVIMTSRVAGLTEARIHNMLQKMGFRGRSIIPLDKNSRISYAEKWIDVTQPAEQNEQLKAAVEQIFNQKKFKYLEEFMSTPLELLLILKQIANDSLSLNRFQMFCDTLWEYLTNHVKRFDQKRSVFEDAMTFLSFIAYQMQLNDSLFISAKELAKLGGELGHLSFHTSLIKGNTVDDYRDFLDSLAANVGIIERDDRTSDIVYTFPIRAFQEFLTAHACCHLRLNAELSRPDPCGILSQHLNDGRWISITNFALSDLGTNNQQEFDAIIRHVFREVSDVEQLRAIVEADLAITKDHALVLCENVFSNQVLMEDQKELLIACMSTKSAYAYSYALRASYQANPSYDKYLEANALAMIIWEYNLGQSAYKKALSCLKNGAVSQANIGAEMISMMSKALMDEVSAAYKGKISKDLRASEELLATLAKNAKSQMNVFGIIALTNIWLSKVEGSERAKQFLTADLASIVIDELNKNTPVIKKLCFAGHEAIKSLDYRRIQELVFTLGSIPFSPSTRNLINHQQGNLFVSTLLQALYQYSKDDVEVDQVAIATACLYYCWDNNRFMEAWTAEICKGMPSEYVRKDLCSIREQNHFDLVRNDLAKLECAYRDAHKDDLNSFNETTSVFSLFRSGDILGAANFCIRTMNSELGSSKTNLAFLIRYGHIEQEDLETQTEYTITDLLAEGVTKQESYALINMALYELELKHYSQANKLLPQITEEGWHDVSETFWYPELWKRINDPEGALVCMLAHAYGNCDFDDYEEMVEAVKRYYGKNVDMVLRP